MVLAESGAQDDGLPLAVFDPDEITGEEESVRAVDPEERGRARSVAGVGITSRSSSIIPRLSNVPATSSDAATSARPFS